MPKPTDRFTAVALSMNRNADIPIVSWLVGKPAPQKTHGARARVRAGTLSPDLLGNPRPPASLDLAMRSLVFTILALGLGSATNGADSANTNRSALPNILFAFHAETLVRWCRSNGRITSTP